jgi:hypothetical protein
VAPQTTHWLLTLAVPAADMVAFEKTKRCRPTIAGWADLMDLDTKPLRARACPRYLSLLTVRTIVGVPTSTRDAS